MKQKAKLNGPQIRLILAGCLCVFVFMATTTPESDGNFCSDYDHGELLVTNNSSTAIWFKWTGPAGGGVTGGGFLVGANSSWVEGGLGTGLYKYVIFESKHIQAGPGMHEEKNTLKKTGSVKIIAQTAIEVVYP